MKIGYYRYKGDIVHYDGNGALNMKTGEDIRIEELVGHGEYIGKDTEEV